MSVVVGLVLAMALTQAAPPATTGAIAGRVAVEGTNAPIAGARVMLFPAGRPNGPMGPPPQATTDEAGRFAFDRVPPGEYRVNVQKTGYAPWGDMGQRETVKVAAGQAPATLEIVLQKGAVIAGRVLERSGEPLTDVRVMAMRRVDPGAGPTRFLPAPGQAMQQTNDLGEFRISGLPPGEYIVAAMPRTVMAFGGVAQTPGAAAGTARIVSATTYYPGTVDEAVAQPIGVAAGAEVGNITFVMQSAAAFRVSGIVVDEDGSPVAGAMVMMNGDPRTGLFGPAGSARTVDDGTFVIGEVTAGRYHVNASLPMTISSAGGSGGGGFVSVSGGAVWGGVAAGVAGGATSTLTMTADGVTRQMMPPAEVVVIDADVTGVRVVIRRPARQ